MLSDQDYTADDRRDGEFIDGTPLNLEVLRNLWAERDDRYVGQTLTDSQIEKVRAFRGLEALDLPAGQRTRAYAEAISWRPPR